MHYYSRELVAVFPGGFHMGARNCLRLHVEIGRFEWARDASSPTPAEGRRRFFFPDRRWAPGAPAAKRRSQLRARVGGRRWVRAVAVLRRCAKRAIFSRRWGHRHFGVWVGGCSSRRFVYGRARLFFDPSWKSGVSNGRATLLSPSPPRSGGFFSHRREETAIPPQSAVEYTRAKWRFCVGRESSGFCATMGRAGIA